MAIKKKKISELPLAQSLVGLFSVGVDKFNRSVKFGLEFVKTAADDATSAAGAATSAAKAAQDAADHPTYVGEDYNVYKWDNVELLYVNTGINVKGATGSQANVVDSLDSTSATEALAAKQGNILNQKIDTRIEGGAIKKIEIVSAYPAVEETGTIYILIS